MRAKRTSKACEYCRRLKEKCDGNTPCARCVRRKRICKFNDGTPNTRASRCIPPADRVATSPTAQNDGYFDVNRIQALEALVEHFTGTSAFDLEHLRQLISSLSQRQNSTQCSMELHADRARNSDNDEFATDAASPSQAVYLGEFSDSNFSMRVQQKLQSQLRNTALEPHSPDSVAIKRSPAAIQLQSKAQVIVDAAALFPPREIADFLLRTFFEFAQTNYFYVDESFLRMQLQRFYSSSLELDNTDSSWVCTVLMMFAIGTQFAHLASREGDGQQSMATSGTDDEIGRSFYHAACRLIPDAIADASITSIQAFLLLGVYTLPVDAATLSCTYLGIAIRIAVQSGMHRNLTKSLDARQVELRRRIFWTAVTLERYSDNTQSGLTIPNWTFTQARQLTTYELNRRICTFHGRPISLARSDIDAELPSEFAELNSPERMDTFPNVLAMIQLTDLLELARDRVTDLKRADKQAQPAVLRSIIELKQQLRQYWLSTAEVTYCRDLDPSKPLFRFNLHLALTYHLTYIFIGRSFIFNAGRRTTQAGHAVGSEVQWNRGMEELVQECIQSAVTIIDLCQVLHDEMGLARSSYTEFTSCCAALLALLAYRIFTRASTLQSSCSKGLLLLKTMTAGIFSGKAERLTIESLEAALQKLDQSGYSNSNPAVRSSENTKSAYLRFHDWAVSWGRGGDESGGTTRGNLLARGADNSQETTNRTPFNASVEESQLEQQPFDPVPALPSDELLWEHFALGEFDAVPGLGEWFQYGLH